MNKVEAIIKEEFDERCSTHGTGLYDWTAWYG